MTTRVLIIGGTGNFGGVIARLLAPDANLHLLIASRSRERAQAFVATLTAANPPDAIALDIDSDLIPTLSQARPDIVVHTTGPFQHQNHRVAEACARLPCHYIDLADARDFVAGITALDAPFRAANRLAISGASSVPCLTAAVIDHYRAHFARLRTVDYGISATQQTNRGLATTSAILSYVGKPFSTRRHGNDIAIWGWQGTRTHRYPELGRRLLADCDIPDLALFPIRYPDLETITFGAGHELAVVHMGLWALSWLVRLRIFNSLQPIGPALLRLSFLFDPFASGSSAFHMTLTGDAPDGKPHSETFHIIAHSGDGPLIPCMPAILLVRALAAGTLRATGARPCLDLIDLPTYCAALRGHDISIHPDPIAHAL